MWMASNIATMAAPQSTRGPVSKSRRFGKCSLAQCSRGTRIAAPARSSRKYRVNLNNMTGDATRLQNKVRRLKKENADLYKLNVRLRKALMASPLAKAPTQLRQP